jgi:hypothetical protein
MAQEYELKAIEFYRKLYRQIFTFIVILFDRLIGRVLSVSNY